MNAFLRIGLLVGLFTCGGCMTSAQRYEEENSEGNYIVKGEITRVEGLSTTQWELLADGFAIVVDHPGAAVTLKQTDQKTTRFALIEGDRIVHNPGGRDFILSSLAPNRPADQATELTDDEAADVADKKEPKED